MESIKRGGAVVMQDYLNAEARHLDFAIGIRSEDGNVRAVIVSSVVSNNTIFPIFSDYTGLGHTGETLLVKLSDHGLMHINPTRHSSIRKIETPGHGKERFRLGTSAASGSEGIDEGIDYRGKRVVGAYRHVPLLNWGIVVKMDVEEAFREITTLRKNFHNRNIDFGHNASDFLFHYKQVYRTPCQSQAKNKGNSIR
ncbi:cache domain-containing protein [Dissulfurispira sp.]|uniref:cache domain-containing protein n=1 Tax=Dissulfurispira sp. TaxID=2817609 RepID=UPI002FD95F4E